MQNCSYKLFINGEDTHVLANIKLGFSMVGHYTHTCQHKGYSLTVCSWWMHCVEQGTILRRGYACSTHRHLTSSQPPEPSGFDCFAEWKDTVFAYYKLGACLNIW